MPIESLLNKTEVRLVRSKETLTPIPRCKQVVRGTLDGRKRSVFTGLVCVTSRCRVRGSVHLEC